MDSPASSLDVIGCCQLTSVIDDHTETCTRAGLTKVRIDHIPLLFECKGRYSGLLFNVTIKTSFDQGTYFGSA